MMNVLWEAGQPTAAIRLEVLWNELAQSHAFSLLCGYSMGSFYKGDAAHAHSCSHHTHLISDASEATRLQ